MPIQDRIQSIPPRDASPVRPFPSLRQFTGAVSSGAGAVPSGLYVNGVLAARVLQQPGGNPAFVTSDPNAVSQFSLAASNGTLGFLAHNHLAGAKFTDLQVGQRVAVIDGEGAPTWFQIQRILAFQALNPTSGLSDFVELSGQQRRLTAETLFGQMYSVPDQLVLQTCIEREGNPYWGRLFVVAVPVDSYLSRQKLVRLEARYHPN